MCVFVLLYILFCQTTEDRELFTRICYIPHTACCFNDGVLRRCHQLFLLKCDAIIWFKPIIFFRKYSCLYAALYYYDTWYAVDWKGYGLTVFQTHFDCNLTTDDLCNMVRKFLGIELVDVLHIPLERRLQTIAVCIYLFIFLFLAVVCGIITVWLWFSPLYVIPLAYFVWFVYDYRTPERGGRRCEWIRSWKIWHHCRDYFPVTLTSTAALDPQKNYLFIYHPHGIIACGACVNFGSNATDFQKHFPGVGCSFAALRYQFFFPICREYILSLGECTG